MISMNKQKTMRTKKRMTNKPILAGLLMAVLFSTLSGLPLLPHANAATYTETVGVLDGAQYAFRIPENWNGMLVVLCRGFSHPAVADARNYSLYPSVAPVLANQGFAVAASTFGAGGYCIGKGMNTTYQLTNYLKETYNITGKVFVIGASMGGAIALLLAEKYPTLYSGVLDLCGAKNSTASYETRTRWANLSDADLTAELTSLTAPVPPYQFSNLTQLRTFCATNAADIVAETGGKPENKSKRYEDVSPIYHTNFTIPVMTVQGTSDALMPLYQTLAFEATMIGSGKSSLYRLYTIQGAQHVDGQIVNQTLPRLMELVNWSQTLQTQPTPTPTPTLTPNPTATPISTQTPSPTPTYTPTPIPTQTPKPTPETTPTPTPTPKPNMTTQPTPTPTTIQTPPTSFTPEPTEPQTSVTSSPEPLVDNQTRAPFEAYAVIAAVSLAAFLTAVVIVVKRKGHK
jgi:pimeloyl-ACP methyl ester carboxylesterase